MDSMTFSEKVESWIYEKSGCKLQDFCRKFKYADLETKIMGLDEHDEKKTKLIVSKDSELKQLYLDCASSEKFISRKGKNRSFTEYFKTLVTGWILEDITLAMFKRQGIEITHNGRDKKRKIKSVGEVSQDPDFIIKIGENERELELSCAFCNILKNEGFIEKRCPSLVNLWNRKALWLYRDIRRGKYVLVDFATERVTLHLRKHNTTCNDWSKDVHRYILEENNKKEHKINKQN